MKISREQISFPSLCNLVRINKIASFRQINIEQLWEFSVRFGSRNFISIVMLGSSTVL